MDLKKIKFISPKDIKKGEEFSFGELFDSNENIDSLLEANKEFIKNHADVEINKEKSILEKRFKEKEEDLREYFDNLKKDLEKSAKSQIEDRVEIEKSKIKSKYEVEKTRSEMLEKQNKENRKIIDSLKETYEEMLESKLDKIREANKKDREELIKEYEDKAKSASTIGENAEEEIRYQLKSLFPNDMIEKPNHAKGEADVLHTIVDSGKSISRIYYEIKNRKNWSNADYQNFANKVRKEDHEFNIYIAQSLPKQTKDQNIRQFNEGFFYDEVNNIYLVSFDNWLPIIVVIRRQAIELEQTKLNAESMDEIRDRVYTFFKSPEFNNYFTRLKKNFDEIEEVFKAIQKATVDGKSIKEKAVLEIANLEAEINSKLNI